MKIVGVWLSILQIIGWDLPCGLQALKHQFDHLSRGQRASMEAAARSKASQQRVTFNLDSETEHSLEDLDARAHSNAELQAHQSGRSKSPPPVRSQMSLSPEPQGRAISAPTLSDDMRWIMERIAMEEDGVFNGAKRHQDIAMMHIHKVRSKICARLCATHTSQLPVLTVMKRNATTVAEQTGALHVFQHGCATRKPYPQAHRASAQAPTL